MHRTSELLDVVDFSQTIDSWTHLLLIQFKLFDMNYMSIVPLMPVTSHMQ